MTTERERDTQREYRERERMRQRGRGVETVRILSLRRKQAVGPGGNQTT